VDEFTGTLLNNVTPVEVNAFGPVDGRVSGASRPSLRRTRSETNRRPGMCCTTGTPADAWRTG